MLGIGLNERLKKMAAPARFPFALRVSALALKPGWDGLTPRITPAMRNDGGYIWANCDDSSKVEYLLAEQKMWVRFPFVAQKPVW